MKQALPAPEAVFLITLDLVERFLHLQPTPLQLDLHERQPVDEDRNVVAVLVAALHRHLLGHLVAVSQRIHRVEELQITRRPVIFRQLHPIPQDLGFGKDAGTFVQVVQYLRKFSFGQRRLVEGF